MHNSNKIYVKIHFDLKIPLIFPTNLSKWSQNRLESFWDSGIGTIRDLAKIGNTYPIPRSALLLLKSVFPRSGLDWCGNGKSCNGWLDLSCIHFVLGKVAFFPCSGWLSDMERDVVFYFWRVEAGKDVEGELWVFTFLPGWAPSSSM
jgi:hypothetical protein